MHYFEESSFPTGDSDYGQNTDLDSFQLEEYGCWLLEYVDDLLLAAETKEKCWEGTKALLQLLVGAGYRVSKKKA